MKGESKMHLNGKGSSKVNGRTASRWAVDKIPAIKPVGVKAQEELNESEINSAKPFPLHCLPPTARAVTSAIADAVGVPTSLTGPTVLGVLSAAIGTGLEVRSGPHRTLRANLYVIASAESGTGKSEAMRLAAASLRSCEKEDLAAFNEMVLPGAEAELEILGVETGSLKNRAKKSLSAEDRAELHDDLREKKAAMAAAEAAKEPPVLTVEDVTVERLAVLLSRRGEMLTSISPDAGSVINNLLGRYNKTDRTDETLYLKAWTGEPCRVDRQGRASIWLERPCLSVLWLVQPDKVDTLLAVQSLKDCGFIQRLLLCHSGCELSKLDENGYAEGAVIITGNAAPDWHALVRCLIGIFRKAEVPPRLVTPTKGASRLFIVHYNSMVDRWQQGELRDITSFAVRWTEQAWRIGLCLHAGQHGQKSANEQLDEDTARCAIELADWFVEQQLAILASTRTDQRRARLERLLRIVGDHGGRVTLRDLSLRNKFTPEETRKMAAEFPALLSVTKVSTQGRPTEIAHLPTISAVLNEKAKK